MQQSVDFLDFATFWRLISSVIVWQQRVSDSGRIEHCWQDWLDIRRLVAASRDLGQTLDWELLEQYFALFDKENLLEALRGEQ